MLGKCSNNDCVAPIHCHAGEDDYKQCEFWKKNNLSSKEKNLDEQNPEEKSNIPWTGAPFQIKDLGQISQRSTPILLGIIGKAAAGKTTFLAMLYTLLLSGKRFCDYSFTGTKTIHGWDELYHKLKVQKNKVSFPDPTPFQYYRLLHFALRNSEEKLKDLVFADASGELFSLWSKNRNDETAENARWIYDNSNGFILFIDCEDLIKRRNLAKTEIIDIAQMLKHDLRNRPIVAVWSKSDKKSEVHPKLKQALEEELQTSFSNLHQIDISNFSDDDPDTLVHVNNLKVVDWLLSKIFVPSEKALVVDKVSSSDILLNYPANE